MFAELHYPQLFDKVLRQTLMGCYRALMPKTSSSVSGGGNGGNGGNGSNGGVNGSNAMYLKNLNSITNNIKNTTTSNTTNSNGVPHNTAGYYPSTNTPYNTNTSNTTANPNNAGANRNAYSMFMQPPTYTTHNGVYSSAYSGDGIPLLTSKQELALFLRWIDTVYSNDTTKPNTTTSTTTTNNTSSTNPTTANNTTKPTKYPTINPSLSIRQNLIERISSHLKEALKHRDADFVVECVRITEYALLCKAHSVGEYMNLSTLAKRIMNEVHEHPDWEIKVVKLRKDSQGNMVPVLINAVKTTNATNTTGTNNTDSNTNSTNSSSDVVDLTDDTPTITTTTNTNPTAWRSLITEEIRQDMIFRVEKMLRMVTQQLGITSLDDLNCKIQQYEMGLVVSSVSLDHYMDTSTMPNRLAQLVSDFAEYKKTLSADQLLG